MRPFWIEIRRSPLRWALPLLIIVDLATLFGRSTYWIGIWPQASAAAQLSALYLGPTAAGLAAWVAARSGRIDAYLSSAARPGWRAEFIRYSAILCYPVAAYALGAILASVLSLPNAGPGFLWGGYLLLGLTTVIICVAIGYLAGRLSRSSLAAPAFSTIGTFIALMALPTLRTGATAGSLEFFVLSGHPNVYLAPIPLTWKVVLALLVSTLAVVLPGLLRRARSGWPSARPRAGAAVGSSAVLIALVFLAASGPLTVYREPVSPLCSKGSPQVCVWPEDRKYLPDLAVMAQRLTGLPDEFTVPKAFFEQGLRGLRPDHADYYADIRIIDGILWSAAGSMSSQVMNGTFRSTLCDTDTSTAADIRGKALWEMDGMIVTIVNGGGRPESVRGGPPLNYGALGRIAQRPDERNRWFLKRLKIVRETPCV